MKYSLRSLMLAAAIGPVVLALFLLGWRQAIPQEARLAADAVGICAFGLNSAAAFVVHRREADWSVLAYICLNLLPLAGLVIDLIS